MDIRTIYLALRNPCSPLYSDKLLLWLASTFAARGTRVESVSAPPSPAENGLVLTNLPLPGGGPAGDGRVLRITSRVDQLNRLMRPLAYIYGKGFFRAEKSSNLAGGLLRLLKRPFRALGPAPLQAPGPMAEPPDGSPLVPPGRRIVLRINVDWDSEGFALLERWCGEFGLRPTLAVAGAEIEGRTNRLRALAASTGAELANHTRSHHVMLPSHGKARQRREITGNRKLLEDLSGSPVTGFVAPYIKYDRTTFELLGEDGCRWFIRSWLVHPLRLAGTGLVDLGYNLLPGKLGWSGFSRRLALSDLCLQLHLHDLPGHREQLETIFRRVAEVKARIIPCGAFLEETLSGGNI